MTNLLVTGSRIGKSYGPTRALTSVDISLRRGEIHALLGGNGAGKSTLIGILEGRLAADTGDLRFTTSHVAVVHQELAILPHLTIAENVALGLSSGPRFHWRRAVDDSSRALEMLGLAGLDPATAVETLPLHQQQLVEIARALCSGAELLLLDEPTASLSREETDRLFTVLRRLRDQAIGIVLVSHRMHEIRQVADVATVLRDGRTVVDAEPVAQMSDARIVEEMFGEAATVGREADAPHDRGEPSGTAPRSTTALRHPATGFEVRVGSGTILGLAGAPDGPRLLMDALLGGGAATGWVADLDGRAWTARSPRAAIGRGIGFVSGDRAGKGIFPELSIAENAVAARQVVRRQFWRRSDRATLRRQAEALGFARVDLDRHPGTLSGGTIQKILIARWLDLPLRMLVLEEPTRGVDVHTKTELYALIRRMAADGLAVVWWSTEVGELLSVTDRILAFTVGGEPADLLETSRTDEAELLQTTGTT